MVRFLVLYPEPTDVDGFERHYFGVHVPLVRKLPGLRRYTVGRGTSPVRGDAAWYMVAELDWDDMESLRRDFASDLGRESAADLDELIELCPGIQSMVFELIEP